MQAPPSKRHRKAPPASSSPIVGGEFSHHRVLFISGTKDKQSPIELLAKLLPTLACETALVPIDDGAHNPFDSMPKAERAAKNELALAAIRRFVALDEDVAPLRTPRVVFVTIAGSFGNFPFEGKDVAHVKLPELLRSFNNGGGLKTGSEAEAGNRGADDGGAAAVATDDGSSSGEAVVVIGPVRGEEDPEKPGERKLLRGGNGITAKVMGHVDAAVRAACTAHPRARVYLATQSFGGRAAVHWLLGRLEQTSKGVKTYPPWAGAKKAPANFRGVIACGYPLAHPTVDRSVVLNMLGQRDSDSEKGKGAT